MLERTYGIFILEIRKARFLPKILWSLIIPFLIITVTVSISVAEMNLGPDIEVKTVLVRIIPYLLITSSCFVLANEFSCHTDKIIFTGIYSRTEVLLSKFAYIVTASLVLYALYMLACFLPGIKSGNVDALQFSSFLSSFFVFLLYGMTVGSFILLISLITKNGIMTGVITYVLFFDLIHTMLAQAAYSANNHMMKWIVNHLPFYVANAGFHIQKYSGGQMITLLVSSMILFIASSMILKRKAL